MVSTSRCGRDNPGSNPGYSKSFSLNSALIFDHWVSSFAVCDRLLIFCKNCLDKMREFPKELSHLKIRGQTFGLLSPNLMKCFKFRPAQIGASLGHNNSEIFKLLTFRQSQEFHPTFSVIFHRATLFRKCEFVQIRILQQPFQKINYS